MATIRPHYHEEEAAVLLQRSQEPQEGHAGDDDAADDEYVSGCQVGSEGRHLDGHQQVDAQSQHRHAAHLAAEKDC